MRGKSTPKSEYTTEFITFYPSTHNATIWTDAISGKDEYGGHKDVYCNGDSQFKDLLRYYRINNRWKEGIIEELNDKEEHVIYHISRSSKYGIKIDGNYNDRTGEVTQLKARKTTAPKKFPRLNVRGMF